MQLKDEQIESLKRQARKKTCYEQKVDCDDFALWSTDDVYLAGKDDGRILLSRILLDDLDIEWREIG